ncbi:MAG TPA: hypothetical protein VKX16_11285 [Chloroflexota bacterium]|nr:hypothetical protein [Chloroflexota bacterium]
MKILTLVLAATLAATTFSAPAAIHGDTAPGVAVSVSPADGDATTPRDVTFSGLPAGSQPIAWLFDPTGNESPLPATADTTGAVSLHLTPPDGSWALGLYRVVVAQAGGDAVSATFAVSDGAPRLEEEPVLPSPTSAFSLIGTGFPPGQTIGLTLTLTGGFGDRPLRTTTDASGSFDTFVWPEQVGLPFFPAGQYRVRVGAFGLETSFWAREHPVSSTMTLDGPVSRSGSTTIHLRCYRRNRYVWAVYAGTNGAIEGQLLLGPTDSAGAVDASVDLSGLAPGTYLLATPYDWGETQFVVSAPTPTATPTSTPRPVHHHKPCSKKERQRKRCHK